MKFRGMLIAVIVLAALTGTLYWSNHHKPAETASADSSAEPAPKILALTVADITAISIHKKGEDSIVLTKDSSGKWQITAPKPLAADQDAVGNVLSPLASLSSDRLVESKAADLSQYGLAQPAVDVQITTKDKKVTDLQIGDDTPTGNGAYATVVGDPRVFTLASYSKASFVRTLNDLRERHLLPFESDKVSRIELQSKKQTVEFGRDKSQWQIVKPSVLRADQSAVEDLLRNLHDAKMDLAAGQDDKKLSSAFNAGTPFATAKVTDASGTQELQIRKNKDDYYAKSTVIAGIYKLSSSTAPSLDKSVDDFRNKKLFDFGFADPDKVEIHDGPKSYVLTHSGEDWLSNGAKMDPESVFPLFEKLRDLAASKFADGGFGAPILDVTVTSDSNKRVEKVVISKSGDKYIGKRENEPALYELAASTVTDLQSAAAGLKPAPAPTPAPAKK
jgi:hypothetical protein